jgi:hypothetical protein
VTPVTSRSPGKAHTLVGGTVREVIHHWWVLGMRAILALLLAAGIFLLQAWAKFSFFDVVTIPFMIVALSLYGILDSGLLLYLGMQFPPRSAMRTLSLAQGFCGIVIGALLITVFFRTAEIPWFLYIISAQAAVTGGFELLFGLRFTRHVREEWSCFATGAASVLFAILLQTSYSGTTRHALDWFLGYALLLAASMGWFSYRLFLLARHLRLEHESGRHQPVAGV